MMDLESSNEIDSRRRRRRRQRRHRHQRQRVLSGMDPTDTATGDDSLDECRFPEIERNIISSSSTHHHHMMSTRGAAATTSSSPMGGCLSDDDDVVDLESGKVEEEEEETVKGDCRICHLKSGEDEVVIHLGCSCKGDLGTAHNDCAQTWFKIRGNRTCEICGSAATNVGVVGIIINHEAAAAVIGGGGIGTTTSSSATAGTGVVVGPTPVMAVGENRILWNGRRFINILLASMIFAFLISWLFHSKLLSS